jgi:asparagine synthase (glutamine-hydrolysing)
MCGIAGIFYFNDQLADSALVEKMVSSLKHRGPDDHGVWTKEHVGLGHARLSILDLSKAAHQPMLDHSSGNVISYNGEVYNFLELKKHQLKESSFQSSSDTEVVLKCLEQDGISAINLFEGMFAFAYYDSSNTTLYLACDQVGIKPLYYHVNQHRIVFASEIKSLFNDRQTPKFPNSQALQQHLLFGYSLAPQTAFKDIYRLEPGHYLKINKEGIKDICYWSPNSVDWDADSSDDFASIFDHSMSVHTRTDVPWGSFLSGGLDSTLMMSSMARGGNINSDFRAFNVGTELSSNHLEKNLVSERQGASSTASYYNFKLEKISYPEPNQINFSNIVSTLEEPICNPAAILIDIICKHAKQLTIPVLLSGHGGDEIFAGYRRHIWAAYLPQIKMASGLLRFMVNFHSSPVWKRMVASSELNVQKAIVMLGAVGWSVITDWNVAPDLFPPQKVWDVFSPLTEKLRPYANLSPLKQMLVLDFMSYLSSQNLIVMDKMSMRHSIESRVPYLHLPLVMNGWTNKDRKLVRRGKGKLPLRQLAKSNLPSALLNTPKLGFDFPLNDWLNSETAQDLLFSSKTKDRGIFDQKALKRYYLQCNTNNIDLMPLYNVATIEQWHRTMIEG